MSVARAVTQHGTFSYFDRDDIGIHIASNQFWEPHLRPMMDAMETTGVFVDCGANIGFFTVYMGLRGARVHAFEASPELFELLQANVSDNGLQGLVTCHNVALYDQDGLVMQLNPEWAPPFLESGKLDYHASTNSGGLSLVPASGVCAYRFTSRTLDSYDLSDVDLIKIDVQGADTRVMRGAEKLIDRCRPGILFENESVPARLHGESLATAYEFLQAKEYDIAVLRSAGDLQDCAASPKWRRI